VKLYFLQKGGAAGGAAKRQHLPEFAVDGPAPSVTPAHFHDILIGTDFRKMICNNAFRLQPTPRFRTGSFDTNDGSFPGAARGQR
jgi:hypothetical protein